MKKIDAIKKVVLRKAKTVQEIREIYSETSEEGHKWVHLDDVNKLVEDLLSDGVMAHVFLDGEEIRLNIADENSSVLVTFQSTKEFKEFQKTIAAFKEAE